MISRLVSSMAFTAHLGDAAANANVKIQTIESARMLEVRTVENIGFSLDTTSTTRHLAATTLPPGSIKENKVPWYIALAIPPTLYTNVLVLFGLFVQVNLIRFLMWVTGHAKKAFKKGVKKVTKGKHEGGFLGSFAFIRLIWMGIDGVFAVLFGGVPPSKFATVLKLTLVSYVIAFLLAYLTALIVHGYSLLSRGKYAAIAVFGIFFQTLSVFCLIKYLISRGRSFLAGLGLVFAVLVGKVFDVLSSANILGSEVLQLFTLCCGTGK